MFYSSEILKWPACTPAKSFQSCPTLCNTMDYSLPSSSIHRLLQARILEWFAMSSFRYLSDLGIKTESLTSPALTDGFFTTSATWEAPKWPGSL